MIISAEPCRPQALPRPQSAAARAGMAFQRKFIKALRTSARPSGIDIHDGEWYSYRNSAGVTGICEPDFILIDDDEGFAIVGEVKLTWVPEAAAKLADLYCPVVSRALHLPARPLVVCKSLVLGAPSPQTTLTKTFIASEPVFQWLGHGPIFW